MMPPFVQTLVVVLMIGSGCSHHPPPVSPPSNRTAPKLELSPPTNEAEARAFVAKYLEQQGINLDIFAPPDIQYARTSREWFFVYNGKPPYVPGGQFYVSVDATGKVSHMGGM
jgi:hypothetical protein